jgi:hypothetical protein
MSKDHPSIDDYYNKYPIPDSKLKKYHKEYKENKKEEDDKLLDSDKKTYIVRSDTPLIHVADMGMSNYHVAIAINSKECNEDFIRLLPTIFTRTNIHLCIMGPNASKFKDIVPDGLMSSLFIDSVSFNYSLAINILIKPIYEKFPMSTIAICDGWTIFSSIQVIQKEMVKIDWDNEFVRVDTAIDYDNDPINLNMDSTRLMSSVLNRLRNMKTPNYHIPIIICRAKYLLDLESGLEEELFTEFSRSHLRNQLITAGLVENVCKENKGLFIRKRITNNSTEQKDIGIIKKIAPRMNNFIFIPSNYEIDFGDSNRIKYMIIDKNIPCWRYLKYKPTLLDIYVSEKFKDKPGDNKVDIEKQGSTKDIISEVVLTDFSKLLDPKHKVLLMINSNIRDLISSTPLIRGLYEKYGSVDILTKDKLETSNTIIQNYMVRKIYDLQDLKNKFFSLKTYGPNIIRTVGCNIGNFKGVNILEPVNIYDNIVETNFSVADPYITDMPKPYCNFEPSKIRSNTIVICISANVDFNTKTDIWKCLDTIGSRVGNDKKINVCFITLSGERKLFLTDKFRIRKNINICDNLTPSKASGIINSGNLFITTSDSQTSWLAWGLDVPTILLDIDSEVPERDSEIRIYIDKRNSKIDIDTIMNQVWRNL